MRGKMEKAFEITIQTKVQSFRYKNPQSFARRITNIKPPIIRQILCFYEILSSFTHHYVVSDLNDFQSSTEHKRRCFEEHWLPNKYSTD